MNVNKVNTLDIPEIAKKVKNGKYHFHEDPRVPMLTLKIWQHRGYNAHKIGIIHVHYSEIDKKYTFPMYFWVIT